MMSNKTFDFTLLFRKKLFIFLVAYASVMMLLLYIANHIYGNTSLSILAFAALILPFLILQYIKGIFKANGTIKINHDNFLFLLEENVEQTHIAFNNIQYYKIFFPAPGFYCVQFRLRNNDNLEFSFIDSKKDGDMIKPLEILSSINQSIKIYNQLNQSSKIEYQLTFIASKNGIIIIRLLSCLIILAIIMHIVLKQFETLPISLMFGILGMIQLQSQRKADLKYYNGHIVSEECSNDR